MSSHQHNSLESEDSDDEPKLNLDSNMLRQLVSSHLDRNCVSTRRLSRGHNNEIHLLQLDNGPDCIARLHAIQAIQPQSSEIYCSKHQNQLPEVYDFIMS